MGLAVEVGGWVGEGLGDGPGIRFASVEGTMDTAVGAGLFAHPAKRVIAISKQQIARIDTRIGSTFLHRNFQKLYLIPSQ